MWFKGMCKGLDLISRTVCLPFSQHFWGWISQLKKEKHPDKKKKQKHFDWKEPCNYIFFPANTHCLLFTGVPSVQAFYGHGIKKPISAFNFHFGKREIAQR